LFTILQVARDDVNHYKLQLDELLKHKDKINEEQNTLSEQMKSIDQGMELVRKRIKDAEVCTLSIYLRCILTSLKHDETTVKQRREQALTDKNHWIAKVAEYETILAGEEATKKEMEAVVKVYSSRLRYHSFSDFTRHTPSRR
jgi:predicted  nucleic acid-binding Zn-ribbon protein